MTNTLACRLLAFAPRERTARCENGVGLSSDWRIGAFKTTATVTRWGEFTVFQNNAALDQSYGSEFTLDLAFSYTLDNWTFTLGGDNVLNAYPDEVIFANSSSGQLPYSNASPFGFNGGLVYASAGFNW